MLAYCQLDSWKKISEIWTGILSFLFKKMHLKILSANMAAIMCRGRWINSGEIWRQKDEWPLLMTGAPIRHQVSKYDDNGLSFCWQAFVTTDAAKSATLCFYRYWFVFQDPIITWDVICNKLIHWGLNRMSRCPIFKYISEFTIKCFDSHITNMFYSHIQ